MIISRFVIIALYIGLLSACASTPRFETANIDSSLTPARASTQSTTGQRVLWGGTIISSTNLENSTLVEVLGYPLDRKQQPKLRSTPTGRFMVSQDGYLETMDLHNGKRITVAGTITETRPGKVGQADYNYPVVNAEDMHLWSNETHEYDKPKVHFGIGVNIGL